MKRRILLLVVIASLLLTPIAVNAAYQQPIQVMIDGERITTATKPVVENARVLVPVRSVAESLGYTVFWDNERKDVYLSKSSTVIKFNLNHSRVWKNGSARNIDVAPKIYQGHTYMPVRAMSESIGANIVWDGSTKTVKINSKVLGNHSEKEQPKEIKEVPEAIQKNQYKIVIDAGHGGHDSGAIGYAGYREKDLNLAIAKKVVALLENEPEIEGIFTRDGDYFISLDSRVNFANTINADLFISIHANALPGKSYINGTQTYYTSYDSLPFARVMHSYLLKGTQFSDKGLLRAGFRVIKYTKMPAVLLELGYMTNYQEEKTMVTSGTFQRRVAGEIVKGIKEYLQVK